MFAQNMCWMKYLLIAGLMHLAENKMTSLPYAPETNGRCSVKDTYFDKKVKLCCSKCMAGFHLKTACSVTADTVCQKCKENTFLKTPNNAKNCFRCNQCREDRGLIYTQSCNTSTDAVCACKQGTYCSLTVGSFCEECTEFTACPPGEGVSEQGTDVSDVICAPCADGSFSDKTSYTETCQKHTDCESQGRNTLRPGNATSDTLCGPIAKISAIGTPTTTTTSTTTSRVPSTSRIQATSSGFATTDTHTSPPSFKTRTPEHKDMTALIVGVAVPVALLLGLIVFLFFLLRQKRRGDTNNNTKKEADKLPHGASADSFHFQPPEQQRLLGEQASSSPSISSTSSSADHKSQAEPEPAAHSCGPVIHSVPEGSKCNESLQANNSAFTIQFSTTVSCHLPPGAHLCPAPTSPITDTASSAGVDLPLSKEEERQEPAKEAHEAVQESGKVVC